ncbi:MAG: transporter [Candidatus Rokubacteria bacterium]|nr:transporter [Candidatus Rokubacteria bacterium]
MRELSSGLLIATLLLSLSAVPAVAQPRPGLNIPAPAPERAALEREHFQLKFGPNYDEGDFGSAEKTRTFSFPVTLRYLGERWDLGLTGSFIRLDTPGNVTIVDGQPQRTGAATGPREVNSGFGDLIVRGRYYLIDDPGPSSFLPSIAPFAKIKFPTADEDRGLGTGKLDGGFGVEWDKSFGPFFLFGDLSYTFIGNPPGQDFRDRPGASLGAGYRITPAVTVSTLLDWRRSLVRGHDDPVELDGFLTVKLSRTLALTPNVFVGLTNGSPDWGAGVEVSWKFGRW